jgi:hypothetical protein
MVSCSDACVSIDSFLKFVRQYNSIVVCARWRLGVCACLCVLVIVSLRCCAHNSVGFVFRKFWHSASTMF